MKKLLSLVISVIFVHFSYAQNTFPFPSSGNVGIGTTSPGAALGFQNVDTDTGNSGITWYNPAPLDYGIYKTTGPWIGPNYQQLKFQWDTGILLNPGSQFGKSYVEVAGGGVRVTGGNVGIGTTSPTRSLSIDGANIYQSFNVNGTEEWAIGNEHTAGDRYIIYNTPHGTYDFTILSSGEVGIGTTDPKGYKLAVAGSAIAESVTVKLQANWPDYVFQPKYKLTPLSEIKSYIGRNHHLPEMPSAAEIRKDGLNLGEMNQLLTKKVEELTLYLIEKDKEIKQIRADKNEQQKAIDQLKQQLNTIENALKQK